MTIGGTRIGRRLVVPLLLVALVAAALSWFAVVHASGEKASRCTVFAASSRARLAHDEGPVDGPRVVVIGDSWSVGLHLPDPDLSWPSRLAAEWGARVHVAGFSGSGFAEHDSPCGAVSYADRAPAAVRGGADLVVVEGGLNDWDASAAAITAGFDRLMSELHAYRVVVVGPAPAPSRISQVPRVDGVLRALAAAHDVRYVSMASIDVPYLPDLLHPTAAGQRTFGDAVADAVTPPSR